MCGLFVLGMWVLASKLGFRVLLLLFFSSTHTPLIFRGTHHCSRHPIAASLPFNCLHLRHSACVAMAIPDAPPTLCLLQCEREADLWLMMQAGCRRHHFPWEEDLFLPLGTKYTELPNIFMEPHQITACQGNISPHALHLPLCSPHRNTAPFKAHFAF